LEFLSDRVDSAVVGASPKPRDFLGMAQVFNDVLLLIAGRLTIFFVLGVAKRSKLCADTTCQGYPSRRCVNDVQSERLGQQ